MKPRIPNYSLRFGAGLLILLGGLFQVFPPSTHAQKNSFQGGVSVTSKNVGGAIEVKIDTTKFGSIKAYLPDDMRAGDTISGTLVTEPKGSTPQEIEANEAELKKLNMQFETISGTTETVTLSTAEFTVRQPTAPELAPLKPNYVKLLVLAPDVPAKPVIVPGRTPNILIDGAELDIPLYPPPKALAVNSFVFPHLSQQGRPIEIQGPFDGDFGNTRVNFGDLKTPPSAQDLGGGRVKVLAESPRKVVFVAPAEVTGPYSITVNEGDKIFTGNTRNIAVNLSAPKTNLMRGEKTTVTIEVSGLAGIMKEVPLQLDARGVINMDGGNFQNLRIKPEEVKLDGRYTTNRTITGVQAGGFTVTATVIVGPFDMCLQDDLDPARGMSWNTFTGDYSFSDPTITMPAGPQGAVAGVSTFGYSPWKGSSLTGTGKPAMKGCIITLSHNAPDRRVFAKLDTCTKTGEASVETPSTKTTVKVTDQNTANNSCPSSAPK